MNRSVRACTTVFVLAITLCVVVAQADECSVFVRTHGNASSDEVINAVTRTADGGFAVTGYTVSTASKAVFVAKYDGTGALRWWKSFGGSGDEEGRGIGETQNGSLIIVGYTQSFDDGADFFIAKRPSNDVPSSWDWTRIWGEGNGQDEELNGVIEATDGNIWVTGYTRSYSSWPYRAQVVLARLSADGTRLIGRYAGNPVLNRDYRGYALAQVFGAYPGFCVTGTFEEDGDQDVLLAKFSSTADFWWAYRIGAGADYDETGTSIIRTSDAGLAMAGWVNFYDGIYPNQKAGFLIKTDSDAQVDWGRRAFGVAPFEPRYCMSVTETFDGGLVVTGRASPYMQEDRLVLSKWSLSGGAIWNHGFELGDQCIGNAVIEDADYSLLVAGSTYAEGSDWTDALVGRWCSTGGTCLPDVDGPSYSSWDAPQQRIALPEPDGHVLDVTLTSWDPVIAQPSLTTTTLCQTVLRTVCPDGSGDYMAIQSAIDAASNGDVIELCDATFVGASNRNLDFHGKCLTLRSQSGHPDDCVIDCQNAGRGFYFHSGEGPDSVVQDVKIVHGTSADGGAGIHCDNASPTIQGCTIRDCSRTGIYCIDASPTISNCQVLNCTSGGGVIASYGSPIISNCRIAGCFSSSGAIGISGGSATITGCQVTGNEGGGIEFDYAGGGTIRDCTVSGNNAGTFAGGLSFFECYDNTEVTNTIVWGNCEPQIRCDGPVGRWGCADASCCDIQGGWSGEDNIDADPMFCEPQSWDDAPTEAGNYGVRPHSVCLPENQPVCGLIGDLGVGCEYDIRVCPDGSADYTTIQAAINAASDGDVIWLCDATYTGPGNRNITFPNKEVTLRSESGDPAACVVNCEGASRGFYIDFGSKARSIENISIVAGSVHGNGGGIRASSGASFTLSGCVISGNYATGNGGGIYGAITILDCTIAGNRAGVLGGGIFGACFPQKTILWGNSTDDHAEWSYPPKQSNWWADGGGLPLGCCNDLGPGCDGFGDIGVACTDQGLDISLDPMFCYAVDSVMAPTDGGDYHLDLDSPCAPANHPDPNCGRLGALRADCLQGCDHKPWSITAEDSLPGSHAR